MNKAGNNLRFLASEDRALADHLWEQRKYTYAILFSQQSVEKILKAYLYLKVQVEPPRTHNLLDLWTLVKLDFPSNLAIEKLKELSLAYTRTRYDDMSYQYYNNKDKVQPLYDFSNSLYLWILNLLQN